jgi:hypothetical protein
MSSRNEVVDRVLEELERYGIRGQVNERGKHLEIAWAYQDGRSRQLFVSRTPSDWRAPVKARADTRKILRTDNIPLQAGTIVSFQKAMSLPKPLPNGMTKEQLLQKDVDALVDLVFELDQRLTETMQRLDNMKVTTTVSFAKADVAEQVVEPQVVAASTQIEKYARGKSKALILAQLPAGQWVPRSVIVAALGKENTQLINQALMRLKKEGLVESGLRGMYRRKAMTASVAS